MSSTQDTYILEHYGQGTLEEIEKICSELGITIMQLAYRCRDLRIIKRINDLRTPIYKEYVLKYYKTKSRKELASVIGANPTRVKQISKSLGVQAMNHLVRSADERKKYIIENYKTKTVKEIQEVIGIDRNNIYVMCKELGVEPLKEKEVASENHKKIILENYKTKTNPELAALLGLSESQTFNLCSKLKVTALPIKLKTKYRWLKLIKKYHKIMTRLDLCSRLKLTERPVIIMCEALGVKPMSQKTKNRKIVREWFKEHPNASLIYAAKQLHFAPATIKKWLRVDKPKPSPKKIPETKVIAAKKFVVGARGSDILVQIRKSNKTMTGKELMKLAATLKFNFGLDSGLSFTERKIKT